MGKCKTRLARTVGDKAALEIYLMLLEKTVAATRNLAVDKWVYYSDHPVECDLWDPQIYKKAEQQGHNLGERMERAFREAFAGGYKAVVIVGSDLYDLRQISSSVLPMTAVIIYLG